MRVPRPRVEYVRRARPEQVTPGDTACMRLEPGLIALLEQPQFDSGYQAPWSVPAGLAVTAAWAVLAPCSQGIDWIGRDLELDCFPAPGLHDTILVEARLEQVSDRRSTFAISAKTTTGALVFTGTLRLIAWLSERGHPAGFSSQQEYQEMRASLKAAALAHAGAGRLRVIRAPKSIPLGRAAEVELEVHNESELPLAIEVECRLPFGDGLSFDSPGVRALQIAPRDVGRTSFRVRADRPHEVNLQQPWPIEIIAGSDTVTLQIAVPDPHPGRMFYLLTEDCETFDGGPLTGNYAALEALGNHNNFMDPEDYRVQMIRKPDRLNRIAERHGARWTHFFAITQRFAADWAAAQSNTGEWTRIAAEMDGSIRAGSATHEYAPHIHFDYEPDSRLEPQPRLLYDSATDGILPNDYWDPVTNPTHRYHDWDGAARGHSYIRALGDWISLDTKAGSLRKCLRHLSRLAANRRAVVTARTGSYDFGETPEDQTVSTRAYAANGLRGNSDAFEAGTAARRGGRMFWCSERDRRQPVTDLREARLVQLGIGRESWFESAEEMNDWFAAEYNSCRGPGIHATVFTCHAMFFGGEPDRFRSLEGGPFLQLDRHLEWVRANYPAVEFATASEAVLEFLDYYTPELEARAEPYVCGGDPVSGRYRFAVRLLGRGIRVDAGHPRTVLVAPPACFSPDELAALRLMQEGCVIAAVQTFDPAVQPGVPVTLTSRAPLTLELQLLPDAIEPALKWFRDGDGVVFHDPPEEPRPDLFFSGDTVRLLMNPVAGHAEPLGRRVHPLTGYAVGAALSAAFQAGAHLPIRLKVRLLHALDPELRYQTSTHVDDGVVVVKIHDDNGEELANAEARSIVEQPSAGDALR